MYFLEVPYSINEIKWRHLKEFCDHPVLFDNTISCNDVKQGNVGDCWFISALNVIVIMKRP